jgi:hypothetical protein
VVLWCEELLSRPFVCGRVPLLWRPRVEMEGQRTLSLWEIKTTASLTDGCELQLTR